MREDRTLIPTNSFDAKLDELRDSLESAFESIEDSLQNFSPDDQTTLSEDLINLQDQLNAGLLEFKQGLSALSNLVEEKPETVSQDEYIQRSIPPLPVSSPVREIEEIEYRKNQVDPSPTKSDEPQLLWYEELPQVERNPEHFYLAHRWFETVGNMLGWKYPLGAIIILVFFIWHFWALD